MASVLLNIYVKDKDLLSYSSYKDDGNTLTFFYKFTNVDKGEINGTNVVELTTPKIQLKEYLLVHVNDQVNVSGHVYVTDNSETIITKIIPSVTYYDITEINKDRVFITVNPSDYIFVFYFDGADVAINGNAKFKVEEYNTSVGKLIVKVAKINDDTSILFSGSKIYSVKYPTCYELMPSSQETVLVKKYNCSSDSLEKGKIVRASSFAVYGSKKLLNSSDSSGEWFSGDRRMIIIVAGVVIIIVTVLVLLSRLDLFSE